GWGGGVGRFEMRMKGMVVTLGALALLLAAQAATASELPITAEYKGDVSKTAGQFTNTTQGSGTCSDHPEYCPDRFFSLLFPWAGNESTTGMGKKKIVVSDDPRDGFYFGFDASEHRVRATNAQGQLHELS